MTQQALEMDMQQRKVTRTLMVKLSPAEKAQAMDEFNQLRDQADALEADFSTTKDKHKAALAEIETNAEKTRLRARNGDPRDVECVEKRFFGSNLVQVWDGDTLLEERAMTAQERQMEIGDTKHGVVEDWEQGTPFLDKAPAEQRAELAELIRSEQSSIKELAI